MMVNTSKLIIGICLVLFSLILFIFKQYFISVVLLILALIIFLNKKEDIIERRKDKDE